PAVAVQDPAGHGDARALRLPRVLDGQVGLGLGDVRVAEAGRPQLDALGVGRLQRLGGVAQDAAAIGRVVEARLVLVLAVLARLDLAADVRLGRHKTDAMPPRREKRYW